MSGHPTYLKIDDPSYPVLPGFCCQAVIKIGLKSTGQQAAGWRGGGPQQANQANCFQLFATPSPKWGMRIQAIPTKCVPSGMRSTVCLRGEHRNNGCQRLPKQCLGWIGWPTAWRVRQRRLRAGSDRSAGGSKRRRCLMPAAETPLVAVAGLRRSGRKSSGSGRCLADVDRTERSWRKRRVADQYLSRLFEREHGRPQCRRQRIDARRRRLVDHHVCLKRGLRLPST